MSTGSLVILPTEPHRPGQVAVLVVANHRVVGGIARVGESWRMWYLAGGGAGLGLATSEDALAWVRASAEPTFRPASAADADVVAHCRMPLASDRSRRFSCWYQCGRNRRKGGRGREASACPPSNRVTTKCRRLGSGSFLGTPSGPRML